jgi:hypothetical protein
MFERRSGLPWLLRLREGNGNSDKYGDNAWADEMSQH